jgi:PAS domain S-box-containing protein
MRDTGAAGTFPDSVEEQYRFLLGCVRDYAIILLDPQGHITTWNAGAERIFGYSEPEILGQPFARLFTPEDLEQGRPEEELHQAQTAMRAADDRWHVRQDGARTWVNGSLTALRDGTGALRGFAKVCRDLTLQKLAQEQRAWLASIVDSSEDAIISKTLDGTITSWNPAAQRLYGWSAAEAVGRPIALLMPPDRPDELPAIMERLRRGERVEHFETVRLRKDGTRVDISVTVSPVRDAEGRVVGASAIARDIGERKRLEAALREANRHKDEFLAVLAHELRNPLAPIRNALDAIRRRGAERRQAVRQGLDIIDRQAAQLGRLVDDLTDASRIALGKVKLDPRPVEVAAVVAHAVETCRPLVDARRQELHVTLPPYPVRLHGDPARLAQVLGNLLTNAAKYTPEGGHVWLSAERQGGEVVLRVRDDGIGISPQMLPRVFDLFTQGEQALNLSAGGLGIGLTLVQRLVELHGGSVEAHSAGPGTGSEFVIRLPLPAEAPPAAAAGPAGGAGGLPAATRRVLVVDDNADAAESLAMVLRLEGHEVLCVHEGAAVLEAARQFRPDTVLLDIALPGGPTGYELAGGLRQEPGLRGVLLVAVTGLGREEDKLRARQAGFHAHLTKPADPGALRALLGTTSGR